jgi:hypothetical protein
MMVELHAPITCMSKFKELLTGSNKVPFSLSDLFNQNRLNKPT